MALCPYCGIDSPYTIFWGTDDDAVYLANKYDITVDEVSDLRTCKDCGTSYIKKGNKFNLVALPSEEGAFSDEDFPFEGESMTDFVRKRLHGID